MNEQAVSNHQVSIGTYLLDRLQSCGLEHIFGVPGDYVLKLDKLIELHTLQYINTTRENNAGYAADAYARIRGLGAACITYGVGINITNAVAQAYVENSPVVVISGSVGTDEFVKHHDMHHLINQSINAHGDKTQLEIFKNVTVDQGVLDDPRTAAAIIDRVIESCLFYKKPVYLELPRNCVDSLIENKRHADPFQYPRADSNALNEALIETENILKRCHQPLIWAGHEILRYGLSAEVLAFAEKLRIPIVSSLLGKTVVDEFHPLFLGVYQGGMSAKPIVDFIQNCDCLISLGVLMHDLDTGIFSAKVDQKHRIFSNQNQLSLGYHQYPDVGLKDFVKGLGQLSLSSPFNSSFIARKDRMAFPFKPVEGSKTTTKRLFECIQNYLTPEHIIVSDVGDCLFGSADLLLAQNSFLACSYFASLGFGTPGAIGAQIAAQKRRVVAIVGDGGFQMTATELSTAVRYGLDPIVIVLNNHGYGTERTLLEGSYNDIVNWKYSELPKVFGGGVGMRVETEEAMDEALQKAFSIRGTFYLIEVELDKLDFSPGLIRLGELLGKVVKS